MQKSLTLIFLSLLVFFGGCGPKSSKIEEATKNRILLLGNAVEPKDLDPHTTTGVSELNILRALYEGLVRPAPKDLSPLPGVAKSWDISEDQKTYTFHLREDARWSNGKPLTSEDFMFSFKRILDPERGAPNAILFYVVAEAEAYNRGEISDFSKTGFKAPDPRTLSIRLKNPTPYFLNLIMHPAWSPVYKPAVNLGSRWTKPATHISNGPFVLKEWKINQVIKVIKNPYYWDRENTWLEQINFFPIDNIHSEERAFLNGELHITESLSPSKAQIYAKQKKDFLRIDPYYGTYYYIINTQKPALKDPRVRLALSLSINREAISHTLMGAGKDPAYQLVPPGYQNYPQLNTLRDEIASPQNLMDEAGYPNGEGFPPLEILFNSHENNRLIAEAIQNMWQTQLGIKVILRNEEWKSYLNSRSNHDFDIARASWIADFTAPESFLDVWRPNSGNNYSGWKNDSYQAKLDEAMKATTLEERIRCLTSAEAELLSAAPILPIYHFTTTYLIDDSVKGWYPTPLNWHPYQDIQLEMSEEF